MTAAEILASALPPADDGVIEKAISDLDAKLWEWTDALKSAQTQLRNAFALRSVPASSAAPAGSSASTAARPSSHLYGEEKGPMPSLAASAAAAHVPSPPPAPEWMTTAAKPEWTQQQQPAQHGAHGAGQSSAFKNLPPSNDWPTPPGQAADPQNAGVMPWPTAPGGTNWPTTGGGNWPSTESATGVQQWPTWTPSDESQGGKSPSSRKSNVRATKAPKAVRPVVEGPTPEERAQKAAAEEALLSELEDAIARRVRLLRRLDPDTPIERLIEKAKQGQAEAQASAPPKEERNATTSSSWWRRK